MEHKLLINQFKGGESEKEILSLVLSWNITNTNVLTHTGMLPFLLYTFFYSFEWRWYAEYKQFPWGCHSVPGISPMSSCCKLNLVPSLGWTDLWLMQLNMEGHFYCPNKTCSPCAHTGNSSSSSSIPLTCAVWCQETLSRRAAFLDLAQGTHYVERETNCLYKIL